MSSSLVGIEAEEVQNTPVIITEVELWGPPTEFGQYRYCREAYGGGAIQWIELFNTSEKMITMEEYNVTNTRGGIISSVADLQLKPKELCLYGFDTTPPQVGPWIPNGIEDASFVFEYLVQENEDLVKYEYRTPAFTDQHNDTRT